MAVITAGSFNSSVLRGLACLRSPAAASRDVADSAKGGGGGRGGGGGGGGGYIYLSLLHRSEGWSTASPSDLNGARKRTVRSEEESRKTRHHRRDSHICINWP